MVGAKYPSTLSPIQEDAGKKNAIERPYLMGRLTNHLLRKKHRNDTNSRNVVIDVWKHRMLRAGATVEIPFVMHDLVLVWEDLKNMLDWRS